MPTAAWLLLKPACLAQVWVYDEATSAVMALGGFTLEDNICLEACVDGNYGQGACSLIENNVGESLGGRFARCYLLLLVPIRGRLVCCSVALRGACSGHQTSCRGHAV